MTYAVKGSGIAYSLIAGTILAEAVQADENGFYTAETLWKYEHDFYHEIGFSAGRIAVMKNILPFITAVDVNEMFKRGLITAEDVDLLFPVIYRNQSCPELPHRK